MSKIKKENAIWNINSFGEYFFQIYEKYSKIYLASCDKIADERSRFSAELSKIPGFTVYPSQANYLLVKIDDRLSSTELALKLLEESNIFIKDLCGKKCFENGGFIRLAVRSCKDDDCLLTKLKQIYN